MKSIFEKSRKGRKGVRLPLSDVPPAEPLSERLSRPLPAALPEVSELDVVRHFTRLSSLNFSVDGNFYPLGSCTMKYNPKAADHAAGLAGFTELHPLLPRLPGGEDFCQGALTLIWELQEILSDLTGMTATSLQPLAGAQGELAGTLIVRAWHSAQGSQRRYVIVPDTSHGTNPASAAMAGYDVLTVSTGPDGLMDEAEFSSRLGSDTAAVILTCPNTLGFYNPGVARISELAHRAGALMYCDGANFNAILGKVKPAEVGFDIVHLNLHKTFATPHGGGGPGAGPISVTRPLAEFLPLPRVERNDDGVCRLRLEAPSSIGSLAGAYGNFAVLVRAYAYVLLQGLEGLRESAEKAVLNANYLRILLRDCYESAYDRPCLHECVFSASRQAEKGIRALDIAKYLIDLGIHPPTTYFPLIVPEALMIEPTETESRETLDEFVQAMKAAAAASPDRLHRAPVNMPVSRLDEVLAARRLDLSFPEAQ